ncbi:MAG TPA: hypothetical protein VGK19_19750 [Capsulimonadaceae bacterium]
MAIDEMRRLEGQQNDDGEPVALSGDPTPASPELLTDEAWLDASGGVLCGLSAFAFQSWFIAMILVQFDLRFFSVGILLGLCVTIFESTRVARRHPAFGRASLAAILIVGLPIIFASLR